MFLLENVYDSLVAKLGIPYGALSYIPELSAGEQSAKWYRLDPSLTKTSWSLRTSYQFSLRIIFYDGACKLKIFVRDHANQDGVELYSWLELDKGSASIHYSTLQLEARGDLARCVSKIWQAIAEEDDKAFAALMQYNVLTGNA